MGGGRFYRCKTQIPDFPLPDRDPGTLTRRDLIVRNHCTWLLSEKDMKGNPRGAKKTQAATSRRITASTSQPPPAHSQATRRRQVQVPGCNKPMVNIIRNNSKTRKT